MNCLKENKIIPADCDTYWDGLQSTGGSIYTPNDFEKFDETQKLLHYTFVF